MLKSFKYRLYPTKRQQRLLSEQLEELRWLWNTLLAERKQAWEERQETVDSFEQKAELPTLKGDVRPGLRQAHSQVVQDVALRLKRAMDAFFRRLRAGETPGYPSWLSAFSRHGTLRLADGSTVGQRGGAQRQWQAAAAVESGREQDHRPSPARRDAQDGDYPPHRHRQMVRDHLE
jgi:transposase